MYSAWITVGFLFIQIITVFHLNGCCWFLISTSTRDECQMEYDRVLIGIMLYWIYSFHSF